MNTFCRFLASIVVTFLIAACGRSDADNISRVLEQCAATSKRAAVYNNNPGVQANFVARESANVDVSNCPQDFRMAFQAHVFAWQQAAPVIANNNLGTALIEGLAAGATDDPRYIGQADQQAAYATQQINDTYYVLTQIAAKYGARIPRSIVGE
jgi:hypothetical protein